MDSNLRYVQTHTQTQLSSKEWPSESKSPLQLFILSSMGAIHLTTPPDWFGYVELR